MKCTHTSLDFIPSPCLGYFFRVFHSIFYFIFHFLIDRKTISSNLHRNSLRVFENIKVFQELFEKHRSIKLQFILVTQWVAFVSICVGATQRISLSVLAWNPHKGPERKTGSGGGKEGPREDRESQLTKVDRREQLAWDSCPEKDTVDRRRQREHGNKAVKRWVSIPSDFVEVLHKIHAHNSLKMHEELQKSVS